MIIIATALVVVTHVDVYLMFIHRAVHRRAACVGHVTPGPRPCVNAPFFMRPPRVSHGAAPCLASGYSPGAVVLHAPSLGARGPWKALPQPAVCTLLLILYG